MSTHKICFYGAIWKVFLKVSSNTHHTCFSEILYQSLQGCKERHDGFIKKPADWSAIRSNDYGYTRMHIINSTHLYMEQVSDDKVLYIEPAHEIRVLIT